MKDIEVNGNEHITAGRDIHIINKPKEPFKKEPQLGIFVKADNLFREKIIETGVIKRGDKEICYSSEALFTSLIILSIPFEAAISIPFQIIPVLEETLEFSEKDHLSTSDIRFAVLESIGGLTYENYSYQEVSMWSAAYVRRYGNPDKDSIKVLDNNEEIDFKYPYVKKVIIPHLFKRIFSIQGVNDPIKNFPSAFNSSNVDKMATEIIRFTNTLNLYCIRYKTLINLLEDLIIEPPHPWIVNEETMDRVTSYNLERAAHHLSQLKKANVVDNAASFNQSSKECFMHLSAAVLSNYGAFLGVGSKYGLLELKRALTLKMNNKILWKFCNFCSIEKDLDVIQCSTDTLLARLNRITHHLSVPDKESKFRALFVAANDFAEVVVSLTERHTEANMLLQRVLKMDSGRFFLSNSAECCKTT